MASVKNLVSDRRETMQQFTHSTFVNSSGKQIKSNHLREYLNVAFSVLEESPKDDLEQFMSLGELFYKRLYFFNYILMVLNIV